ncbi:MAG: histidine phosphatase family protein [Desulfobulbaceae bacterium]
MTRVLLIRHAAVDGVERGLLVGASDVPASLRELRKLARLAPVLEGFRPDAWYCSPQLRARQTMARLEELCKMGGKPVMDERLREIDFGRWEMKSFAEIADADPELVAAWTEYAHFTFPEGEAVATFCRRASDVLADLRVSDHREAALVSHGGMIRTLICLALGLSPKNYLLFDVRPGTLAVLDLHPEGAVLVGLNL